MTDGSRMLFDFSHPSAASEWQIVNDDVMGGVSDGRFRITDQKTLEFTGRLSLENNGGFASIRTRPRSLGLVSGDALLIRLRGDGREYSLNLYVPRPLIAFSYRASLPTRPGEWIEARIPLETFVATRFGRVILDAGPVEPAEVNTLGFLLGDKIAGPFLLEVDSIRVLREKATE